MHAIRIRAASRGFSIVEALVALVVLSIGMLGIAALYVESLRAGRSAIYRTQAVNLASDMADRIRANRQGRNSYALPAGAAAPSPQTCSPPGTMNCTAQQLAQDDLAQWVASIAAQLPGNGARPASGIVTVTPSAGAPLPSEYTIQVTWFEPGEAQPLSYVLNMQI